MINYFKSNWEPTKEQWVVCFKDEVLSLGETTNNRIDSKFSTLRQLFDEFLTVLKTLRNERNNQFFMALTKKNNSIKYNDEIMFAELVTPYAFKFIQQEKNVSLKVSYQVIPSSEGYDFKLVGHNGSYLCSKQSCTCNYVKKLSLPCHHIFYLRRYLNVSLYDDAIVNLNVHIHMQGVAALKDKAYFGKQNYKITKFQYHTSLSTNNPRLNCWADR